MDDAVLAHLRFFAACAPFVVRQLTMVVRSFPRPTAPPGSSEKKHDNKLAYAVLELKLGALPLLST